jgi:tyrosyl-tRNA synthetase
MRDAGLEPQVCLTTPLLEGLDGEHKMSKSLGNYVGLEFEANDMFGKVMSLPDRLMEKYFLLVTGVSEPEIARLLKSEHPKECKKRLAREITAAFHGEQAALHAEEAFERLFRDRELPETIEQIEIPASEAPGGSLWVVRLLVLLGFAKTNSEARRLVEGGGVKLDQQKIADPDLQVSLSKPVLVQAGKRRFARAVLQQSGC